MKKEIYTKKYKKCPKCKGTGVIKDEGGNIVCLYCKYGYIPIYVKEIR